jgi:TrmH family RNA methyltransferase
MRSIPVNTRWKRYKKESQHSYVFGVYPTLEMLSRVPDFVIGVLVHPKGIDSEGVQQIQKYCERQSISISYQEKVFPRLGARENDYVIGIFKKKEPGLHPPADHGVLVNPANMGNLGTIIRTMVGFNFLDLGIIQPSVDIFHPDVVRASMGALFQIRFERFLDFKAYTRRYPRELYPLLTTGETVLSIVRFSRPFGLIFGNESSGLPDDYLEVGTSVVIPQSKNIDSLNLAVAVGITLYQAQNS